MVILAFGMPAAPEWIFIGILALVLFGPRKLPEIARGLGKALGEIQKAKEDFHREITGAPPLPKIALPPGVRPAVSENAAAEDSGVTPAATVPPPETPEKKGA